LEYRNQLSGVCSGAVYSSSHKDLRSVSICLNHSVYVSILSSILSCTYSLLKKKNEFNIKVNLKKFLFRSRESLKVPEGCGSQNSRQSAREAGKVFNPKHRPSLPPGDVPDTHFY
jgi:hypothetical protein